MTEPTISNSSKKPCKSQISQAPSSPGDRKKWN